MYFMKAGKCSGLQDCGIIINYIILHIYICIYMWMQIYPCRLRELFHPSKKKNRTKKMADRRFFFTDLVSFRKLQDNLRPGTSKSWIVCKDYHSKTIQAPKNDGGKKTSCWAGGEWFILVLSLLSQPWKTAGTPNPKFHAFILWRCISGFLPRHPKKDVYMNSNTRLPPQAGNRLHPRSFGLNLLPTSIGICKNSTM